MSRRPVITNDAVVRETPARWATSIRVTRAAVASSSAILIRVRRLAVTHGAARRPRTPSLRRSTAVSRRKSTL